MTKIFALKKEYEIRGKIKLRSDKIEKILTWPIPQNQIVVRVFLDTIQSIRCQVLGFTELMRPLTYLIGKKEWRWTESEEVIFQILCHVYVTKIAMFGWDLTLPVNLYSDTSNFVAEYYIIQVQDGETRPFVNDLFTLLLAKCNYSI